MKPLTLEQMKALPTKRLLAYKKKLYTCYPLTDDWTFECECNGCLATQQRCRDWDHYLTLVKQVLATREHISTPGKEAFFAKSNYWKRIRRRKTC